MVDEQDLTISPLLAFESLDRSVDELDALLSLKAFTRQLRKKRQQIIEESEALLRAELSAPGRTDSLIEKKLQEREYLFAQVLERISEVFWIGLPDGHSTAYISALCKEIWGYPAEAFYQNPDFWLDTFEGKDRNTLTAAIQRLVDGVDERVELDLAIRNHDGERRELRIYLFSFGDEQGPRFPAGLIEDLTQDRLQDRELLHAISLLRATLDSTTDGILVFDPEGHIIDYNSRFFTLWELRPEILDDLDTTRLLDAVAEHLVEPDMLHFNPQESGVKLLQTRDERFVECSVRPQKLGDKLYGVIWSCRDVTEQVQARELIEYQASYDQLTGLPNRRLLEERLMLSVSRCRRYNRIGALLFLDLDNFKNINDTLGHPVGDALLSEVADRLKSCLRQEDTASRIGGDEFVLLLSEFEAGRDRVSDQAGIVAEKVLETVGDAYELQGHKLYVTTSIGITIFPGSNDSVVELLKQADTAMYKAKQSGRNTFRFFYPNMQQASQTRLDLQNDLHQALKQDQFSLYWLPLYNPAGSVVGAEALLRWNHPEQGLMLPDAFIGVAEESGVMRALGDWVLAESVRFLHRLTNGLKQQRNIYLSVNIGLQQFQQKDFANRLMALLERQGVNPARLMIELKEDVLSGNQQDVLENMQALKRLGIRFSIDDFGTGLSSLPALKRLPLDEVKIDHSFINQVIKDPVTLDIVEAMISMASKLNLDVVAEGVESLKERDFLVSKGCKLFQGRFFSEPLTQDGFWQQLLDQERNQEGDYDTQSQFEGF